MKPMKKRLLSLLLTLVTILSLLPTAAFAASNTGSGLKITTNQAYWSTRLLANGTPYSYRPPLVDGKLVYCMDSGLGYTKIVGISTVLAGLMSAVAVIGAKISNNQHKTDQAWDWLKRIWVAWAIINGIGAFIAYVAPLFSGLATLTP